MSGRSTSSRSTDTTSAWRSHARSRIGISRKPRPVKPVPRASTSCTSQRTSGGNVAAATRATASAHGRSPAGRLAQAGPARLSTRLPSRPCRTIATSMIATNATSAADAAAPTSRHARRWRVPVAVPPPAASAAAPPGARPWRRRTRAAPPRAASIPGAECRRPSGWGRCPRPGPVEPRPRRARPALRRLPRAPPVTAERRRTGGPPSRRALHRRRCTGGSVAMP